MYRPSVGTAVDYRGQSRACGTWRNVLRGLALSLLLPSAAAVYGLTATIDFEQFAPAPNTCAPHVPQIHTVHAGVATFYRGQLATGLAGAHDQTTVYWSNIQCPPMSEEIDIDFSVPVSNVQFMLENLERDQPTTTYQVCDDLGHCESPELTAPGIAPYPLSSTTIVTFPYSGIHRISVISEGEGWNFLIDNVTFSFPFPHSRPALVNVWNQLGCATGVGPGAACAAIQAALLRFGFAFPTATPTETPLPSPCGAVGEPCCLPAAGPPCIAGSCDPLSNTCVAPTPTPTASPVACGGSGEPCCPSPAGPSCSAGTCDPATNTCP